MSVENETRVQMAAFLPDALRAALRSYAVFSMRDVDIDPKKFSEHHTACKVAIAHIELLMKWAERVVETTDDDQARAVLVETMDAARHDLGAYYREADEGDQTDDGA